MNYLIKKDTNYILIHADGSIIDLANHLDLAQQIARGDNPGDFEITCPDTWLSSQPTAKHYFYAELNRGAELVASWTIGLLDVDLLKFNSYCVWAKVSPRPVKLIGVAEFARMTGTKRQLLSNYKLRAQNAMLNRKFHFVDVPFPLPATTAGGAKWTQEQVDTYIKVRKQNFNNALKS